MKGVVESRGCSVQRGRSACREGSRQSRFGFRGAPGKEATADYDSDKSWTTEALAAVAIAEGAFATLKSILNEGVVQNYLVSLVIRPRE
jgi:hypothetical protein